jgi:hypothetical protein
LSSCTIGSVSRRAQLHERVSEAYGIILLCVCVCMYVYVPSIMP